MIWIPMRGLFLTCIESSFYCPTHKQSRAMNFYIKKEKKERKNLLTSWWQISILSGPLLFPPSPRPLSHQKDIYVHTDDINMPATPVGHN
jgi:hypothetical protein